MEENKLQNILFLNTIIFVILLLMVIVIVIVINQNKKQSNQPSDIKPITDTVVKYVYVDQDNKPINDGSYWFVTIETIDGKVGSGVYKTDCPTFSPTNIKEQMEIELEKKYPGKDYSYVLINFAIQITESEYNRYVESKYY